MQSVRDFFHRVFADWNSEKERVTINLPCEDTMEYSEVNTMSENNNDTSLEDFFSTLYACIIKDKIQNSFKNFEYKLLNDKNKLYQAIESYKNNKTFFYSNFLFDYPKINIKRIGEIHMGKNYYCEGRGAFHDGTYFMKFTVYYEKL